MDQRIHTTERNTRVEVGTASLSLLQVIRLLLDFIDLGFYIDTTLYRENICLVSMDLVLGMLCNTRAKKKIQVNSSFSGKVNTSVI